MDSQGDGEDVFGVFSPIAESELGYREKSPKELDHFFLGCMLGKGSYGKVKEAVDRATRKLVAIKIIKERLLIKTPGGVDAVHREIEIWQSLDHPCVVKMHDHFAIEEKEKIYIVMEHVRCGNLHDIVTKSPEQKLPISQTRKYFRDLFEGICYIHSMGVIHKDIKPANCLISVDHTLKIGDFGVAEKKADLSIARRVSTVNAVGSPAFQPPEIASGKENVPDFTVDVWALGVCLYFMVCGYYPFKGENVIVLLDNIAHCHWELPDHVDEKTQSLISAILKVEKADRIELQKIRDHEWMLIEDPVIQMNSKGQYTVKKQSKSEETPWVSIHNAPSMFTFDSKGLVKMDFLDADVEDPDFNRKNHGSCCRLT